MLYYMLGILTLVLPAIIVPLQSRKIRRHQEDYRARELKALHDVQQFDKF